MIARPDQRQKLQADIDAFLAAGGKIDRLDPVCILFRDTPPEPVAKPATIPTMDDPRWAVIPGWPRHMAHPDGYVWSSRKRQVLEVTIRSNRVRLNSGRKFVRLTMAEIMAMTFGGDE